MEEKKAQKITIKLDDRDPHPSDAFIGDEHQVTLPGEGEEPELKKIDDKTFILKLK